MYKWQCPNCGWAGQITDELQAAAVREADKIKATHHIEHCPRCQWVVRIPVDVLRTAALTAKPAAQKSIAKKSAAKKKAVKKVAAKKPAKKPAVKKAVANKRPAAKKPASKRRQ
ncbi:MAG TPA: hypothetical protein VFF70_08270 [Anaerolineae bacterium]|nr:hypothetical protein [Anaerolineae bacterium]